MVTLLFTRILFILVCITTSMSAATDESGQWTEFSFVLKPSKVQGVGGIGVFATHDIPAGTPLFRQGWPDVRILKIKDVPASALKYCVFINDEECFAPERFDRMGIGWFLNHSDDPNIAKIYASQVLDDAYDFYYNWQMHQFYAIKDIKAGDEIVLDYNELNEPEPLKEDYYAKRECSE